jgi:hypothetical protein
MFSCLPLEGAGVICNLELELNGKHPNSDGTITGFSQFNYDSIEVEAKVESFENGRGFTLRVLRAGKPRTQINCQ